MPIQAGQFVDEARGNIGFSGKFTIDPDFQYCIGEHDEKNKLNGKGIILTPNQNICIGNYSNHKHAPGHFINLYFDR
jgi:hypothetical protein